MSKFEQYNVVLKDLNNETLVYEYTLDEEYFKKIDSPEVQKGHINATVKAKKKNTAFELDFFLEGTILIPCDRCLDTMEQVISYKEKLQVKFGNKFSEEDEIVIVPESEGAINVAWFLYEFIVLNIQHFIILVIVLWSFSIPQGSNNLSKSYLNDMIF